MSEGSLEAPVRHPIAWNDPDFDDPDKLDAEMRRQFDVCHGCRRCFNLCDSFPRLFDLIDESETFELDGVDSKDFKSVVDACTLCDMCFMTKCPYVPPHEFQIDFPHLMLRYRVMEHRQRKRQGPEKLLTDTDRSGRMGTTVPGIANWASSTENGLTRRMMQRTLHVHPEAALPRFAGRPLTSRARSEVPEVNTAAPAHGRKAVIYATCYGNWNEPEIGVAARQVLARNGVETEVVYPGCCGMPQLEQGAIEDVAGRAKKVAAEMARWIDDGYDVVALVPSCALMLKFEWPLIVTDDDDVRKLSGATRDITQYVVEIANKEGLADGLQPLDGGVTFHVACHARAQNMGQKGAEMLRLIPGLDLQVIERCSGHGGSWGVLEQNFETAMKVGRPVFRQAAQSVKEAAEQGATRYVSSECPLAGMHIAQGVARTDADATVEKAPHPILLLARSYGLTD